MMTNIAPPPSLKEGAGKLEEGGSLHLESGKVDAGDGSQFRAALERHMQQNGQGSAPVQPASNASLGDKVMSRASDLAGELKGDQKHVSRMLENATRTGDSMQLMKAMMALNDYQLRVQFVSKVVSKATSSLDQLTKLQ